MPDAPPPPGLPEGWSRRLAAQAGARRSDSRQRAIEAPRGLDFCSNDYLGLRRDPRLAEAAAAAARDFGAGSGAARLLRGTSPLHDQLEAELAAWKGFEAALLLNTGYQANATLIPALAGAGDAVFSDALNHASLVDGCRLAKARGAMVAVYGHLDLGDLEARLARWRAAAPVEALALVATDAVFSMDGDAADLPALRALCDRHGALLLADEAHASGLLGPEGQGLAAHQGTQAHLSMGTLGKALGAAGAFVCGDRALIDHLVNTCRGFIFSTALPPAAVGAALEGLRISRAEPWRRERALAWAGRIRAALDQSDQPSAIVPVMLGEARRALAAAAVLQERGFDVRAVRPPTVPPGASRLRITTGAHQAEADLDALIQSLKELP
ncbi:MAG TPA: 8-amino-7-oxononanoate synthase [Holophagaceae bacterium]|nr:8-amino-7-oxononanoate synthase [Holophagaceae bacterium]